MFKQNKMTTHHKAISQGANLNNVSNLTNTKLMIDANLSLSLSLSLSLYIYIYIYIMSSEFRTASYFKPHIITVFRTSHYCGQMTVYNTIHCIKKEKYISVF